MKNNYHKKESKKIEKNEKFMANDFNLAQTDRNKFSTVAHKKKE